MSKKLEQKLYTIIDKTQVKTDEIMSLHTTFRVGGAADYFVNVKTIDEIKALLLLCEEEQEPYYILGNGSNLLVSDSGYRGLIIHIGKEFGIIEREGNCIRAQAGALLSQVANEAWKAGLAGIEFAAGIPGSLGGALIMNAGAYGGEMKNIVSEVTALDKSGSVHVLKGEMLEFGYRSSILMKKGYIALEAVIQLEQGDKEAIKAVMDELKEKRTTKQPLQYPSAGSTFKRPEGYFAGKLIEDAGLRGFQVGGAQVSQKHCGFVINAGDATASDIVNLMEQVSGKVQEQFGVTLEPEVRKLGEF